MRSKGDPSTGRRVSRLNPAGEWIVKELPQLRIIADDVWTAVKERQTQIRRALSNTPGLGRAKRPRYLFTGLTKCGVCGRDFIMAGAHRLACFGAREQGICTNKLTMRRDELEARVLRALQERLLEKDLFAEFCQEFTREMNRLRMERRASLSAAERELEHVRTEIQRIIVAIKQGVPGTEVKDEMTVLQERKTALIGQLEAADQPPPLLHPNMADVYRRKVTQLAAALQQEDERTEATEALRGLIDEITLSPAGGELRIELKGNLAAMLNAATNAKRSPETGDLLLQVQMVAGAGYQRYRTLALRVG